MEAHDKKRKRAPYMCRACGQPKKDHVCTIEGGKPGAAVKKAKPASAGRLKINLINSATQMGGEVVAAADYRPLTVTQGIPIHLKVEKEEKEVELTTEAMHRQLAMAALGGPPQPQMQYHSPAAAAAAAVAAAKLKEEVQVIMSMDEFQHARLTDDLGAYLTRFLHQAIIRRPRGKQVTLPLRVRAPVWPSIIEILHERYAGCLQLNTEEEIKELLKEGARKEWKLGVVEEEDEDGTKKKKVVGDGSWATITPPLVVHFDVQKRDFVAQLRYAVFNEYGKLQFPFEWGKK